MVDLGKGSGGGGGRSAYLFFFRPYRGPQPLPYHAQTPDISPSAPNHGINIYTGVSDIGELKQQRRRRLPKRRLKSEFTLPQTLSRLFHLV